MSASADRLTAARYLIRVDDGAFASRLLGDRAGPGVRVRVLGVLRWQRLLDHVLSAFSRRPLAALDREVRVSLRLGLLERGEMGLPAAVAVDGAVRLVRELGLGSATGLVNAVLRRATGAWEEATAELPDDLRWSHPEWLAARWRELLGEECARGAMAAAQRPAPVWAWLVDPEVARRLADGGSELRPHPWCPGAWAPRGEVGPLLAEVARRRAYVQDPTSQLVAHLAARLAPDDAALVDLCAAPGGKSALAHRLRVWRPALALDLRLPRLRLMGPLAAALGGPLLAAADASRPPLAERAWDLVVLDAPCSGTGTLRRHPELRWRLTPQAIASLAATQGRMVAAAAGLVARGGVLLYATCSLEPEENEAHFVTPPAGFEPVDLEPHLPEGTPRLATSAGGVRVPTHRDGDGFTVHTLRRTS